MTIWKNLCFASAALLISTAGAAFAQSGQTSQTDTAESANPHSVNNKDKSNGPGGPSAKTTDAQSDAAQSENPHRAKPKHSTRKKSTKTTGDHAAEAGNPHSVDNPKTDSPK